MTTQRVRIKTTLPIDEVEKLKAWALERQTTVTAVIRQLIRYGEFIEGIEKSADRRLLVEEADGRMFEIRWVDPVKDAE
ncbi:MAG TPA: hypothetical protein VE954_06280 [Oligoflexus sp.]|uniref:hypothetical protein n=1 Tax=Oligoflexus sp. TaxID=1971216 RepID=UPI002D652E5B|nr:hypothetical protein [Oligoflexus sp.]HYX32702.1 hypothetical protein [Oligoflexus sp.]